MDIGNQGKHIPNAHNFEKGKSEILISEERLKQLAQPKLGDGIRHMFSFGEANYREYVDFGEFIGVHVSSETGVRTQTTLGEIHYSNKGGYHVVPMHPDVLKIKGKQ